MKDFYNSENKPIPIHFDEKKRSKSPKVHANAKPRHKGSSYNSASTHMSRGVAGEGFNYNEENSESPADLDQERHEYEQETINYERFVKKCNIKKPAAAGAKNRSNR